MREGRRTSMPAAVFTGGERDAPYRVLPAVVRPPARSIGRASGSRGCARGRRPRAWDAFPPRHSTAPTATRPPRASGRRTRRIARVGRRPQPRDRRRGGRWGARRDGDLRRPTFPPRHSAVASATRPCAFSGRRTRRSRSRRSPPPAAQFVVGHHVPCAPGRRPAAYERVPICGIHPGGERAAVMPSALWTDGR